MDADRNFFQELNKDKIKGEVTHYSSNVTQRVGRGKALLFHVLDTRRG
jgi:hypothetical protein